MSAHCEVCGKALTDPVSVARGIGPECFAKGLSAKQVVEHLAEQVVEELPEGMIALNEAYNYIKRETDIPPTRLLTACGGNRQLVPPISPLFRMIRYRGRRYLPKECISPEGLAILEGLGKRKRKGEAEAKSAPKTKSEPKAKAKGEVVLKKADSSIALPGKSFIDQTTGETYDWPTKSEVSRMRREELVLLYERLQGVPPADAFSREDLIDAIEHMR